MTGKKGDNKPQYMLKLGNKAEKRKEKKQKQRRQNNKKNSKNDKLKQEKTTLLQNYKLNETSN